MIFDHIGIYIKDFEKSKAFYAAALMPLGIESAMEGEGWCGFGKNGKPELWLSQDPLKQTHLHMAFVADNREQVNAFYKAAMAAGGKDNGPPGLRLQYHPNYYGAFVLDPDGQNIEAVCQTA